MEVDTVTKRIPPKSPGRPRGARSASAEVRRVFGHAIGEICQRALTLARAGDPAGIEACATLLAAALSPRERQ